MATETTNLQLKKPAEADFYSVADFNDNWDKVDAAVGATKAAEAYDPAAAYALGAFCTKDGKLWKCSTAIPAGEAWNETHWTEVTLADLLEGKQDALTFDAAPTAGSENPVTSEGILLALLNKANVESAMSWSDHIAQATFNDGAIVRSYSGWVGTETTGTPYAAYWNVLGLGCSAKNGKHGTQIIIDMNRRDALYMRQGINEDGFSYWIRLATAIDLETRAKSFGLIPAEVYNDAAYPTAYTGSIRSDQVNGLPYSQWAHIIYIPGDTAGYGAQIAIPFYSKKGMQVRTSTLKVWGGWSGELLNTPIKLTATVPTASWALSGSCYQQTVAVAGLLASDDLQNAEIIPAGNKTDPAAQVLTDEAYSVMAGPGAIPTGNCFSGAPREPPSRR